MRDVTGIGNNQRTVPQKFWKYGWGLIFVCAMTVLAEWGERSTHHSAASVTTTSAFSTPGGAATSNTR
jgi:hypothetical protein